MGVAAVIGAVGAAGVYTASKAANQQKQAQQAALAQQQQAQQQAKQAATAQAQRADIEYNRAVRKQPEVEAIVSASEQAAKSGPAATILTKNKKQGSGSLLTGQIGVDPSSLNLSSNTLLGS